MSSVLATLLAGIGLGAMGLGALTIFLQDDTPILPRRRDEEDRR